MKPDGRCRRAAPSLKGTNRADAVRRFQRRKMLFPFTSGFTRRYYICPLRGLFKNADRIKNF
ncbi:MAG: hypothetical protein LH472_15585 [Pyrinomonadaceae bacterium]|nr:hypothetical protein [Pyrinomonadaceae bacterium]